MPKIELPPCPAPGCGTNKAVELTSARGGTVALLCNYNRGGCGGMTGKRTREEDAIAQWTPSEKVSKSETLLNLIRFNDSLITIKSTGDGGSVHIDFPYLAKAQRAHKLLVLALKEEDMPK